MSDNPARPSASPPREFWLGPNGVILSIEEFESQKPNRIHQKGVHVVEYSAYGQVCEELYATKRSLLCCEAELEKCRGELLALKQDCSHTYLLEKIRALAAKLKKFKVYGTTDCANNNDGYMSKGCHGRVSIFIANEKCIGCDPESYAINNTGDENE